MSEFKLNIERIQEFLPHRAPFLLVDRILEIHPTGDLNDVSSNNKTGTRVVGIKNVSFNEAFFQGHFPGFAIMPGVLITESMAQVASFSLYPYMHRDLDKYRGKFQCILVGIESARFRRPVVPGDALRIETTVTKTRSKLWAFGCSATVDGQKVAEAEILANLIFTDDVVSPHSGEAR
jgi:3-hydroxyacyl-[acyl-carrier-protein] dehydratase